MNNSEIKRDTREPISIGDAHVVERTNDMSLNDFIEKIREKTQRVLAEKANGANHS